MRRILLLTPQLPYPPMQGTSLRNWNIIRGLSPEAEITLLSFIETDGGAVGAPVHVPEPLLQHCAAIHVVQAPGRTRRDRLIGLMSSPEPDLAQRLRSEPFSIALERLLRTESFDLVQVEGLEMARYMPLVQELQPFALTVLDCHNAETELQRRAYLTDRRQPARWPAAGYSRVQLGRLESYERWACLLADGVAAVSETDAAHLRRLMGAAGRPIVVVPNCIDMTEYDVNASLVGHEFDLVFSGKMDYRPNVDGVLWFGHEVWPALRASRPDLTWAIVGQRPSVRLEELGRQSGITITGRVEHVQPYLAGGRVYILPLRIGSGTRLKLLEAMASGKAIVSTTVGAEGLPVTDGAELLLADTPEQFAAAIESLLDASELRRRLETNARQFAQNYDWRVVIPRFQSLYASLRGRGQAAESPTGG